MPQHTLDPTAPRLSGLDICLRDQTLNLIDALDVTFIQHYDNGSIATVTSVRLHGTQVDYLDTLMDETVAAFMWGKPGDVARAASKVHRLARRHARAIDRVGS